MFNPMDLPDTIPLFPLPGALLLPRARLPLQIFEPKYLAMLDDVLKTSQRLIGMVQPIAGGDTLHSVGCVGRVVGFSETDDGRYMITLTGVSRYRITQQISGFKPYLTAQVDWQGFERDLGAAEKNGEFNKLSFVDLLERFFNAEELDTDWDSLKEADEELLVNSLSMLAPFSVEDKQALLEAVTLKQRRDVLVALMEFSVHRGQQKGTMQ